MKKFIPAVQGSLFRLLQICVFSMICMVGYGQLLINIDFSSDTTIRKVGTAAVGLSTNDYWNIHSHYIPKYLPGMPLVSNAVTSQLKTSDGLPINVSVVVSNAPGAWRNSTGDEMFDSYIYASNGSNITVTIIGLPSGKYHFYLYGYAEPDVNGEQNTIFKLISNTNQFGPLKGSGFRNWKLSQSWSEGKQFVVFKDVPVVEGTPVNIICEPEAGGIAVINGLQILSLGTAPPLPVAKPEMVTVTGITNLVIHEVSLDGVLNAGSANYLATIKAESFVTNEVSELLFEGEAAVEQNTNDHCRVVGDGSKFYLLADRPGKHIIQVRLFTKVKQDREWLFTEFGIPRTVMGLVKVRTSGKDSEIRATGLAVSRTEKSNDETLIEGYTISNERIGLRWSVLPAMSPAEAVVTADTTGFIKATPIGLRYSTKITHFIRKTPVNELSIEIPKDQSVIKLEGPQIRDWYIKTNLTANKVTIIFLNPVQNECTITVETESKISSLPALQKLSLPSPINVAQETGFLILDCEDVQLSVEDAFGVRQVNTSGQGKYAFRMVSRPLFINARVSALVPSVKAHSSLDFRIEDTRAQMSCFLDLSVEKTRIYNLVIDIPAGFNPTSVRGDGMADWKVNNRRLEIEFTGGIFGKKELEIGFEKIDRTFPRTILVTPIRLQNAERESFDVKISAAPGIEVKPSRIVSLRERPTFVNRKPGYFLEYTSTQPEWELEIICQQLVPKIDSEIINIVTIGDDIVGGSAILRYSIANQGIQQFTVELPEHWRNVDFTGAGIRKKEFKDGKWHIGLQDKFWGGYTLVVTYDFPLGRASEEINIGGIHACNVNRETGLIIITSTGGLEIKPSVIKGNITRIDESEIKPADRSLILRPILYAWKYSASDYFLSLITTRLDQQPLASAVVDRLDLTTVVNDEGQTLTKAIYRIKNKDRVYQRLFLPAQAQFWACYINNAASVIERDNETLLIPMPKTGDPNEPVTVEVVYSQKIKSFKSNLPKRIEIAGPKTDSPTSYTEWQLFVPDKYRLVAMAGNMQSVRGSFYTMNDAWREFVKLVNDNVRILLVTFAVMCGVCFVIALVKLSRLYRFGNYLVTILLTVLVIGILSGILLPSIAAAKARAINISSMNNLKQIGMAIQLFAKEKGRLPASLSEVQETGGLADKVTIDPISGQRYMYVGNGVKLEELFENSIVAFSPEPYEKRRLVLYLDGSVKQISESSFNEEFNKGFLKFKQFDAKAEGVSQLMLNAEAVPEANARQEKLHMKLAQPAPLTALPQSMGKSVAEEKTPLQAQATNLPTAAGVKPVIIEVPKDGYSFLFTRILQNQSEQPIIKALCAPLRTFIAARIIFQLSLFLVGLFILWRAFSKTQISAFRVAFGFSLVFWATVYCLLGWGVLHFAMFIALWSIVLLPVVVLKIIIDRIKPKVHENQAIKICLLISMGMSCVFSTHAETLPCAITFMNASYTGTISDTSIVFSAKIDFTSTRSNALVKLFGPELALKRFKLSSTNSIVSRKDNFSVLTVFEPGRYSIECDFVPRYVDEAGRRCISFTVPPATASKFLINISGNDFDVEFPSAVWYTTKHFQNSTVVDAVVGSDGQVNMYWSPKIGKTLEAITSIFSTNATIVKIESGAINLSSTFRYDVLQGRLRKLQILMPTNLIMVQLSGHDVLNWSLLRNQNSNILDIELVKEISTNCTIKLESLLRFEALPAKLSVPIPISLGVKREVVIAAVQMEEELESQITTSAFHQIDPQEFEKTTGQKSEPFKSAWRAVVTQDDSRPHPQHPILLMQVAKLKPLIDAVVRNHYYIGFEEHRIVSKIEMEVKQAGVFDFEFLVPQEFNVVNVSGMQLTGWIEEITAQGRRIVVSLDKKFIGSWTGQIEMVNFKGQLAKEIEIKSVWPRNISKLNAYILVIADEGISIKTAKSNGLVEIPASAILQPDIKPVSQNNTSEQKPASSIGAGSLGFKATSDYSKPENPWTLTIAAEALPPWITAETCTWAVFADGVSTGQAMIKYSIANAPVNELKLRLPPDLKNVEIFGPDIKHKEFSNNVCKIELQRKIKGDYFLKVNYELTQPDQAMPFAVATIITEEVERQFGYILVACRPPLTIEEQESADLLKIDTRDLPEWGQIHSLRPTVSYKYLRPDFKLNIKILKHSEAEVLQAFINKVQMTSALSVNGNILNELVLSMQNNGLNGFELNLPTNSVLWSVTVADRAVTVKNKNNVLIIPLIGASSRGQSFEVHIVYSAQIKFPHQKGFVELISPAFNLPFKDALWTIYLPAGWAYDKFSGTMTLASVGVTSKSKSKTEGLFSEAQYYLEQYSIKSAFETKMKKDISIARKSLEAGDFKNAVDTFSQVQSQAIKAKDQEQLKIIGSQIRKIQSSNLLAAQEEFASKGSNLSVSEEAESPFLQRDLQVAEQQLDKLQQAQQISEVSIRPLKVTIPKAGVPVQFVRSMQPEVKKPLIVKFLATENTSPRWGQRILIVVASFVILFIVATVLLRSSEHKTKSDRE
jgi:competence protein ComGC